MGRNLAIFLVLFCLALDCKEMAVTWPLILLLYERIVDRHATKRSARLAPIATAAVSALLYGLVKTQMSNQMSITPLTSRGYRFRL